MQAHGKRTILGWYYWPARDMNFIIIAVILLCCLSHLVRTLKARRALRRTRVRQYSRLDQGEQYSSDKAWTPSVNSRGRIYCSSVELGNWLYLAIFPKWMYAPESVSDAIWTVLYCGLMAFYCYYSTPSIRKWTVQYQHDELRAVRR